MASLAKQAAEAVAMPDDPRRTCDRCVSLRILARWDTHCVRVARRQPEAMGPVERARIGHSLVCEAGVHLLARQLAPRRGSSRPYAEAMGHLKRVRAGNPRRTHRRHNVLCVLPRWSEPRLCIQ